ncbi:MAG: glutamate--cysteine ligase [Deltaproteobacteria bacterium]|nr:glutamate--cysteine ligase [Deltaproteobacteria bacterium]
MNTRPGPRHLFQAFGVELEYMIVDRQSLNVLPISDWLLSQIGQHGVREVERGAVMWSNELAMHVIELKGNGPVSDMSTLTEPFMSNIRYINHVLSAKNACLMSGAVHPWMNPDADTQLWLFEDAPIYNALHRSFGCHGHGWFNLQSAHLNLPFANDEEFARLHAAIRLVLPIIPALAAASPFLDGRDTGVADARVNEYSQHCNRLPEAIGDVIPEPVRSESQYHDVILSPLYKALEKVDPAGILQYEWSNARGAIARFDRNTIEVRLIDVQEHPGMDNAVLGAVAAVIRLLCDQAQSDLEAMNAIANGQLRAILDATVQHAEKAFIHCTDYLRLLTGSDAPRSGARLWRDVLMRCNHFSGAVREQAEWIIEHGTLASRMRRQCGPVTRASLTKLARDLCRSLDAGTPIPGNRI